MALSVVIRAVGRIKQWYEPAIAEYESRASRYFDFTGEHVRDEPVRNSRDVGRAVEAEGERLVAKLQEGERLLALTRTGERWSSERLAWYLGECQNLAVRRCRFVIGGAYGLSKPILDRSDVKLSLSACTLPHDLARLVLTEQIYRAGTVLRGEPYHKSHFHGTG